MPSRKRSVASIGTECELSCSSEPDIRTRRKLCKSTAKVVAADTGELRQLTRRGHNAIEKRYRTNLNDKIVQLRDSVANLRVITRREIIDEHERENESTEKYGKAVILTRAVEYITHLEDCTEHLGRDIEALKCRVIAFEKLAMAGLVPEGYTSNLKPVKTESLESIKADFQDSTHYKAKKLTTELKTPKRRNSKKSAS